jgi:para-aminobenzoate synthetase component 2
MPKVLVIDNYDSFTYNLVQYLQELGASTVVWRNDEYPKDQVLEKVTELKPSHILISPGPGRPSDAGISLDIIELFKSKIPILGVCLGMQAMGELAGAKLVYAPELMHGKTSEILIRSHHPLFRDIPTNYRATRYHSLILDRESVDNCSNLELLAETKDGLVMAISYSETPNLVGVQYHPESILSEFGYELLGNFLALE